MVQNRNSLEFLNDKPKQTKPTRIPETIQNLVIGSHIKKSRHINRLSGLIRNLKQLHFRRFHKVTSFGPIEVKSTCDFRLTNPSINLNIYFHRLACIDDNFFW